MIFGCKLPAGYTIETGTPGEDDYQFFNLAPGTDKKPSATSVPNTVGAAWFKANKKLRHVLDKTLYVIRVE